MGKREHGRGTPIGANFSNERMLNRLSRLKFAPIVIVPPLLFSPTARQPFPLGALITQKLRASVRRVICRFVKAIGHSSLSKNRSACIC